MKNSTNNDSGHTHWVFKDPEFMQDLLDDILYGARRPEGYYRKKYFIPEALINSYIVDLLERVPNHIGVFDISNNRINKTISIKFSEKVTKKEYDTAWEFIQWYKRERLGLIPTKKRRRSPENTKLIYAIFKARQQEPTMTFKKIFQLYQDGELPLYNGSRNLTSEDKLERYYDRYKPNMPDS